MAGVLSFTLGLETSKFLSGLGLASGGIISFAGAMQGLNRIVDGVWSAIERGGALTDLSNRTGESVRNLYQLEEAFKAVGLGSEGVSPMLLRLQRALAGFDESGRKTDELFQSMGIDLQSLKSLDAPQQLERMAGALGKMSKEDASGLASRLFGREGSGAMLQITRDFEAFRKSLGESGESANAVARTAAAFDQIGDTITTIKMKVGGMFAGIAEGAAPVLQKILDFVNSVDWVGIGENIGTMLGGLYKAFEIGELGGLMMQAISAMFDSLPALALAGVQKLGAMLLSAFRTPLVYLQAGIEYAIDQLANNPKVRKLIVGAGGPAAMAWNQIAPAGGQATSWEQIFRERMESGPEFFMPGLGLDEINGAANEALKNALAGMKDAMGPIWARLAELGVGFSLPGLKQPGSGGGGGLDIGGGSGRATDVSEWEKMGLVMRGGGAGNDYARTTADNTRTMVGQIRETNRLLSARGAAMALTGID